jgi:hypothetical protein
LAKYPDAGTLFALNMQRVRREQEISQEKLAELAGFIVPTSALLNMREEMLLLTTWSKSLQF